MAANGFSGAIKLSGDDFISPGLECIKPIPVDRTKRDQAGGAVIELEADGSAVQVSESGERKKLEKATIQLSDCLACSGCITSAESVLINEQSKDEFLRVVREENKHVVVSISPQSRASLAAAYNLSPAETAQKLVTLFTECLGAAAVFDTTFARDLSLLEVQKEFAERVERDAAGDATALPMLVSSCPGWICFAEKQLGEDVLPLISTVKSPQQIMGTLVKTVYAGSVGLTRGDIYHVSVMPCFDKKLEATRADFEDPSDGSRDVDCVLTTTEVADVARLLQEEGVPALSRGFVGLENGSALSTFSSYTEDGVPYGDGGEGAGGALEAVYRYIQREWCDSTNNNNNNNNNNIPYSYPLRRNTNFRQTVLVPSGVDVSAYASSGGDGSEAATLPTTATTTTATATTTTANTPMNTPSRPLVLAAVYGLNNIQNLVRQLEAAGKVSRGSDESERGGTRIGGRVGGGTRAKRRRGAGGAESDDVALVEGVDVNELSASVVAAHGYDLVEVMACPKACVNGGGQMSRVPPETVNEHYARVDGLYKDVVVRYPEDNPGLGDVYAALGDKTKELFHTQYHHVEPLEKTNALFTQW